MLNKRIIILSVRGLDEMVRCLDSLQENQRKYTDGKIITFLSIQPCTLEELWKITKIHKNTLVTRLNSLVSRRLVIRHRFLMQFNNQCYGYLKQINFKPNAKFKRFYYILNISHPQINELINLYYNFQESLNTNSKNICHYKKGKENEIVKGQIEQLRKQQEEYLDAIVEGEKRIQKKKKGIDKDCQDPISA